MGNTKSSQCVWYYLHAANSDGLSHLPSPSITARYPLSTPRHPKHFPLYLAHRKAFFAATTLPPPPNLDSMTHY